MPQTNSAVRVVGSGAALPVKVVTNHGLAKTMETSHDWIVERTGIHQRYVCGPDESTGTLALEAARKALTNAGLVGSDIDLIIVATTTPDYSFPSVAVGVQTAIGAGGAAFDVQAVCSGFIYALSIAHNMLRGGQGKRALVLGAEAMTKLLDWEDRGTAVLFGDGAGAVVLERTEEAMTGTSRGIIDTHLQSDGQYFDILHTTGGVGRTQTAGVIAMKGRELFRQAVDKLAATATHILAKNKVTAADVDWFIPHQANIRIIDAMAQKLGLPREKVFLTIHEHANTSAASIPLALDAAVQAGKLKPGQLVLCEAIGAGLTWGSALLRW